MCTKEETAEIINHEFYREGGLRDNLVDEIDQAIDARVGRWLIGGGIIMIFTISAAWFTLNNEVSNNSAKINDALTTDQAALIIQRIDQLERTLTDRNSTIEKLDERLRAKGI